MIRLGISLITLLLLTLVGIAGLIAGDGSWTWLFVGLAVFPLPVGGLLILLRQAWLGYRELCAQSPADI